MQSVREGGLSGSHGSWLHLTVASLVGLALGIACLALPPAWVLGSLVLAGGVVVTLRRPEIGLVGLVVVTASLLPEDQMPRIPIGIGRLVIADVFVLGLLGLVALRWVVEPDFRLSLTPLGLPLLGFYGMAMLSTFIAVSGSALTLNESLGEARALSSYLAFLVVTSLVREKRQLRALWNGLLLVATIVAVAMIAQYVLGSSVHLLPGRVEVLYTEGVTFGGVTRIVPPGESLVVVAFIVLTAGLALDEAKPSWILRSLQWAVLGVGVLLTFGRHLWVSVGVALLVLACLGGREARRRLAGLGVLAALLAALVLGPSANIPGSRAASLAEASVARLSTLTKSETYEDPNSSLRWRDFEYAYALSQVAAHPLTGLGLGARYRPLVLGRDWEGFDGRRYIHNGHLYVMVKAGFLGYLFFAWLSLAYLYRVFRSWRRVPEPGLRASTFGFGLAFLAVLMGSTLSPMLVSSNWTAIIGIMLGMGEAVMEWSSL